MTISNQTPRSGPYTGNGSTTSFSYTFRADREAELVVVLEEDNSETVQTITTHYTVTGVGNANGGTIEMVTAPTSDQTLTIRRAVTRQQTIDLQNRKSVIPQVIEDGFDALTRQVQDLSERMDRAALFPVSGSVTGVQYPAPSAGAAIGWNATGDGLANISSLPVAGVVASTDNAIMRYDSATGGLQDSAILISDAGVLNFSNGWEISGTAVTASAAEINKLDGLATTKAELGYVAGVTSAIQTQLDAKATTTQLNLKAPLADPTFTGAPLAPTAPTGNSTARIATTEFVQNHNQRFHLQYRNSSGSDGAALTGLAWNDAPLLSIYNSIVGASVIGGEITLPSGVYEIHGWSGVASVFGGAEYSGKSRLRNTADSATVAIGASTSASGYAGGRLTESLVLPVTGVFTIAGTKTFRLQSWCDQANLRFGYSVGSGESEVYADLMIYRVG